MNINSLNVKLLRDCAGNSGKEYTDVQLVKEWGAYQQMLGEADEPYTFEEWLEAGLQEGDCASFILGEDD